MIRNEDKATDILKLGKKEMSLYNINKKAKASSGHVPYKGSISVLAKITLAYIRFKLFLKSFSYELRFRMLL